MVKVTMVKVTMVKVTMVAVTMVKVSLVEVTVVEVEVNMVYVSIVNVTVVEVTTLEVTRVKVTLATRFLTVIRIYFDQKNSEKIFPPSINLQNNHFHFNQTMPALTLDFESYSIYCYP